MYSGQDVQADWMTLMGQAHATAGIYFGECLERLMEKLDYEKPSLQVVEAAIKLAEVAAMDFHSSCISIAAQKISAAIDNLASACRDE